MGKYTEAEDLRKLYREIDSAKLNDNDLEFYIRFAEAEIDGVLANRYTLPFSETPQLVRDMSAELSLIKVLDRYFTGQAQDENDWRNTRKEELDRLLAGVNSGTISLVSSAGTVIQPADGLVYVTSTTEDYTPTFGVGDVINEEVDPDRIEDEQNERS